MSKAVKAVIISLLLFVVFFAFYSYFVKATLDRIVRIKDSRLTILKLDEGLVNIAKLKINYRDSEAAQRETVKYFVPAEGTVDFIKYLETVAMGEGMTLAIDDFKIDSTQFADTAESMIFKVTLKGSWNQMMKMLRLYENLPYGGNFLSASFERAFEDEAGSKNKKTVPNWFGHFEFNVYKLK